VTIQVQASAEVADALRLGRPVVALETTLIAHGFAGGQGFDVALAAEHRVRCAGATPATVGIMDGTVRVGLDSAEIERFAAAGGSARKAGARDLAVCAAQGALGATTVGGTLAVCRGLGIRFMGTGGIGGVHRGFAETLDISGDLMQIARTPALVVASGAKSILDVGATAELLETLGVPVLGWRTATLPLFYRAEGGPAVAATVSTPEETARIAELHWQLNPSSGLLLAQPPASGLDIEPLIAEAVQRVRRAGVSGQAVTPAVLALVHELSGGRSVAVNRQLVADNAALAAELAVAYAGQPG
jgi:pseudouridylate synthase